MVKFNKFNFLWVYLATIFFSCSNIPSAAYEKSIEVPLWDSVPTVNPLCNAVWDKKKNKNKKIRKLRVVETLYL